LGIINEVQRRFSIEKVPSILEGGPLVLIAMGLLAIILSSVVQIFFKVLEVSLL
jgi:hypothetical protein